MKPTAFLFYTSTALSIVLGLPAFAVMPSSDLCGNSVCAVALDGADAAAPVIRVSGDDDDDEGGWLRIGDDDDDEDEEDDDDEDCDDDDGACGGAAANPAPAGSTTPPANGLFGNGKPPVAVTN